MRKPFSWIMAIMSPVAFLATASGLTIEKVRCNVCIRPSYLLKKCFRRDGAQHRLLSNTREQSLGNHCRGFRHCDARALQGLHLFTGRTVASRNDRARMAH